MNLTETLQAIRDGSPETEPFAHFSFPGAYPIYYLTRIGDVLCPACANKNKELCADPSDSEFHIVAMDCNFEDVNLYCEHCNESIAAAYADEQLKDLNES